ncbi:sensor histidine kinase [Paenibacillus hexagrammi]|uniref:Histidine kinase n=1 Tax=Paenibacillus hexagrammi TaxID=2908839 RepID=A0ABY3SD24_9BACL|nr:histidine kinase [Paenibacillus sp. YPD9-1]UJF31841.1 histidine kinase [Paenibacillus sp. YPD9-1]
MFPKSIRSKLMSLMLITTLIPAGISITVTYFVTKSTITEKSIAENTRILSLGEDNMSNYLGGIHQLIMSVYSGINLPNSLYTSLLNAKPVSSAPYSLGSTDIRDIVSNQLFNMYQSNKDIYQIHLFVVANKQSNTLLNGFFRRERNDAYIPVIAVKGDKRPVVEPIHLDHRYGLKTNIPNLKSGTTEVMSVHVPIYRTPSDEAMAYLSIDLRASGLEAITKSMFDPTAEQIFLVDGQGDIIYASEAAMSGKNIQIGWDQARKDQMRKDQMRKDQMSGYYRWQDGIVFFQRVDSPLFEGWLLKRVHDHYLYEETRKITGINAGIGTLFLIIGAAASVLISFRFTSPIKKLIAFTQKVQTGQFNAQVDVENEDEIGLLTRKITGMTATIHQLIENEYRLEIANKTNQLKALQAQINPHFLYNALQSIATTSLRYQAVKVYDLIYSLGSMMRYAMATEETSVTLETEMEHVHNYLLLQQERFGGELSVQVDVEPSARQCKIPKMIIQPLVENVFKHGFADSIQQGQIHIEIKLETTDRLIISVSDNGKGMSENMMNLIEVELSKKSVVANDKIGLINVLARLRLHVGQEAKLLMRPNEPSGLKVVIQIPING